MSSSSPPPEAQASGPTLALLLALLADRCCALGESEERYRLLVEQSPYPIAVHQEGRLVFANAAAAALLGAPEPDVLVGRSVLELVAPGSRRAVRERMERLYAHGGSLSLEERALHGVDGRRVRAEIGAARVLWEGAPAIQLVARDVTEQRRSEERARRRAERQREIEQLESLGHLAGELAREFGRRAAAMVRDSDELLGELPYGSPQAPGLRELRGSALGLCRLADRLGTLAHGSSGPPESLHLSTLCTDAAEALEAASCGAELTYDLTAVLPTVRGDPTRLRRALLDLVHFAARRAGRGGSVAIRTGLRKLDRAALARTHGGSESRPGSYVFLEVRDGGPPLSRAQRRHLFEPYHPDTPSLPGAALPRALAALRPHGGVAHVEGGSSRGLCIALLLPAERRRRASRGPRPAPSLRSLPPR